MKNQYFGDIKDLFKYDLGEFLINEIPELERFTFIPMLTPDDKGPDGNKLNYDGRPGSKNTNRTWQASVGFMFPKQALSITGRWRSGWVSEFRKRDI